MKHALALTLLVSISLLVGCSSDKPAEAEEQAQAPATASLDTAQKTILAFGQAMANSQPEQVMALMTNAKDGHKKLITAMCGMMASDKQVREAMVKTYGKEAEAALGESKFPMADEEYLAGLEVTVDGDKATAKTSGSKGEGGKDMALVKKDGQWKIDADSMELPPTEKELNRAIGMINAMQGVCEKLLPLIGQEGQTPETIAETGNKLMMNVMMKMMAQPN